MYVKEIWRYPVKSMAGEQLTEAHVGKAGIAGDRLVLVDRGDGRTLTARTHPGLLGLKGTLSNDGHALINGVSWDSPESLELVRAIAGAQARLFFHDGPERFDVLPLLVATDGAIDHMGFDGRRFRPNILIGGVAGLEERSWPGKRLRVGEVTIFAAHLRARCVMTTWHPDTQIQDPSVLRRIVHELGGTMALDCSVDLPGTIKVGDQVTVQGSIL